MLVKEIICMVTISQINLAGGRPIPETTQLKVTYTGFPEKVHVLIQLPWQKTWKDLGLLPVVGTKLVLPLKLAFLCHAKEDKQQVEEIGSRLLEDGFLTWYDEKDLLPGDDWEDVIEREIEGCDFFLAFLSSQSVTKIGYVNRDYAMLSNSVTADHMDSGLSFPSCSTHASHRAYSSVFIF